MSGNAFDEAVKLDVKQIRKQWDAVKFQADRSTTTDKAAKYNRRNKTWFACAYFDNLLNVIDELMATIEKQVETIKECRSTIGLHEVAVDQLSGEIERLKAALDQIERVVNDESQPKHRDKSQRTKYFWKGYDAALGVVRLAALAEKPRSGAGKPEVDDV